MNSKVATKIQVKLAAIPVRNNCQIGQWVIGDKEIGKELFFYPIKIQNFFGNLGKTSNAQWMQIFFITGEKDRTIVPKNTVCVTYIKTASLRNFVIEIAMRSEKNILFKAEFAPKESAKGKYYQLNFSTEEGEEGVEKAIEEFLKSKDYQNLEDNYLPKEMMRYSSILELEEAKNTLNQLQLEGE